LLDGQGNKIDLVDDIGVAMGHTREVTSRMGTGGMATKLQAAKLVTHAGEIAVIANGRMPNVLTRLFAAEPGVGTVVVPSRRKLDSRRRWIALTKRSSGSVAVDAGAARALLKGGKSLLPIGVTAVHGTFKKGAALDVLDPDGKPIARGLTNYDNEELNHIKGKRSNQFEKILGRPGYAEVIHRDNLVLAEAPA
jgi:glutamate 5-kinase